jgi:hypothetical protein
MSTTRTDSKIPLNKEVCLLLLRDHYYRIAMSPELLIEYAKMIGTTTLEKALQDVMVSLNEIYVELEKIEMEKKKCGKHE